MTDLTAAVWRAINRVVDPCSAVIGVPIGLRDLGLVDEVLVDDRNGDVSIVLCTTSPGCLYAPAMAEEVQREVSVVPGVQLVAVSVDHGAVWTDARLDAQALSLLSERRHRGAGLDDLRPYSWDLEGPAGG